MDVQAGPRGLSTTTGRGPTWSSATARSGWAVLVLISITGALNHVLGVVTFATSEDERLAFTMFAGVNVYATAVLLVPYRRRELWAWLVTWLQVAAFASVLPLAGGGIGLGYLVVAAIAALAQLATLPDLRSGLARQVPDPRAPSRT